MKIETTKFPGLLIIHPDVFGDNRGWFTESYNLNKFKDLGIETIFVQDNHSFSAQKGTLRGLHFQKGLAAQTKLVRCVKGALWDVAVDLREGSPTYMQWMGLELSAQNHLQFYIPQGFAHGFVTLTDDVEIEYKVDAFYSKEHDSGIRFDDPTVNVDWTLHLQGKEPILSDKDKNLQFLKDVKTDFKFKGNE